MSDAVRFHATLDVTAQSAHVVEEFSVSFLKARGYNVAAPNEAWETPLAWRRRLGLCKHALARALRKPNCPHVLLNRGPTRRILELLSNPDFDAFCRRNCK